MITYPLKDIQRVINKKDEEIEKLKAENKKLLLMQSKLRECVEFYAYTNMSSECFTTGRARKCLAELSDSSESVSLKELYER